MRLKIETIINNNVLLLVIVVLTIVAYFKILWFDFVFWDDDKQIINNIYVLHWSAEHLKYNFFNERFTFIPLTLYSITYNIFGYNSLVFHAISLIFHFINILLINAFIRRLNFSFFIVCFVTILFALHPLRIESVAWISEWKDLLFTMFCLLGLNVYIKWLQKPSIIRFIGYVLLALLAGYSKVQGMLLPFTAILVEWYYTKTLNFKNILKNIFVFAFVLLFYKKLSWYVLILLFIFYILENKLVFNRYKKYVYLLGLIFTALLIVKVFISRKIWFWSGNFEYNFYERLLFSGYALFFYLKQFFLPIKQIAIHAYPMQHGAELFKIYGLYLLTWGFLFALIIILLKYKRYSELFALTIFIINIAIVLHFIPIEGRLLVAERYTYFAYTGMFLFSGLFLEKIIKHQYFLWGLTILLLFTNVFLTYSRVDVWKDTKTLFNSVLKQRANTDFAWQNLGSFYLNQKQYDSSIVCYNNAIKINPKDAQQYLNLSLAYMAINKYNEAIKNIERAIHLARTDEEKSFFLTTKGQMLLTANNTDSAIHYFRKSIDIFAGNSKAYLQLAQWYLSKLKIDSAMLYCNKALEINAYYVEALNFRSTLWLYKGNINAAKEDLNRVLSLQPSNSLANNSMGYILYNEKKYDEALDYYTKALKNDSTIIEIYKNRAQIYYEKNQYILAKRDYQKYLNIKKTDYVALANISYCLIQLKDYQQAYWQLIQGKQYYPDSLIFDYYLALLFESNNLYDSAQFYYSRLIQKKDIPLYRYYRAKMNYQKGKFLNALNDFEAILKKSGQNAEILFWIAKCYISLNNKEKACMYFNESARLGFKMAKKEIVNYCN